MNRLLVGIGCVAGLYLLAPALSSLFMILQSSLLFGALSHMMLVTCVTIPLLFTRPMMGLGLLLTSIFAPSAMALACAVGTTLAVGAFVTVSLGAAIGGALAFVARSARDLFSEIGQLFSSKQDSNEKWNPSPDPQLQQPVSQTPAPSAPLFDCESRGVRYSGTRFFGSPQGQNATNSEDYSESHEVDFGR